MTTDFIPDGEMASTDDFDAALSRVLLAALENDVDPRGTWEYRTDGATPNMEIMVVELAD